MTRRTACSMIPAALLAREDLSLGTTSAYPWLAPGPQGDVLLSWTESAPERAVCWARFDGRAWSAPRAIVRDPNLLLNWADFPSVCALSGRRLAAHWLVRHPVEKFATSVRIGYSEDDGRTWRTVYQAGEKLTDDYAGFVSLAAWKDRFGAVYLAPSGHGHHGKSLRWVEFDERANVVADEEIDADVCSCCQTSVVITSDGPVVAYRDHTGASRDISVSRRVRGRWTEPRTLGADNWEINACPVNGPSLAARGRSVAAAWFTGAQGKARVQVAFSSDAGAAFTTALRVDGGKPLGRVSTALLEDGSALVSWLERLNEDSAAVRIRRVKAGLLSEPVDVAKVAASRASGFPRIVPWRDNLLVAWRSDHVETSVMPLRRFA